MHLSMCPLFVTNLGVLGFICCEKSIGVFHYPLDFDHSTFAPIQPSFLYSSFKNALRRVLYILLFSSNSLLSFVLISFN
jgi:hypothetical protein